MARMKTDANGLTIKQEKFAQKYIETGNASEAYRQSYNAGRMKPESVHRKAFEVLENVNVAARLVKLRASAAKRNEITVNDLIAELHEARQVALAADTPQASAAIAATLGKAKLLGLDKQLIELTGKDGGAIQHNHTALDYSRLSNRELARLKDLAKKAQVDAAGDQS